MDKTKEFDEVSLGLIEFSVEEKAAVAAALREIVNRMEDNTNTSNPPSIPIDEAKSFYQPFTTLTDLTKDNMVVNEINADILQNISGIDVISSKNNNQVTVDVGETNEINNPNIDSEMNSENSNDELVICLIDDDTKVIEKNTQTAANTKTLENSESKKTRKKQRSQIDTIDSKPGTIVIDVPIAKTQAVTSLNAKVLTDLTRWLCPECGIEVPDSRHWKLHLYSEHDFHSAEKLNMSLALNASGARVFECKECSSQFGISTTTEALLRHRIRHSPQPSFFECRLCTWRNDSQLTVLRHLRSFHKGTNKPKGSQLMSLVTIYCMICNKHQPNRGELQKHLKSKHSTELIARANACQHGDFEKPSCSICKETFDTLSDVREHLMQHEPFKSFECSICQHRSTYIEESSNHIHSNHVLRLVLEDNNQPCMQKQKNKRKQDVNNGKPKKNKK